MIDKIAEAIQYLAESLDKPGRALRGGLAGQLDELAAIIPFSDTMGWTDENNSVSGRDLLEHWGALQPNQEGLDAGDILGFGAEVVLDPTNIVGGGIFKKLMGASDILKHALPDEVLRATKAVDMSGNPIRYLGDATKDAHFGQAKFVADPDYLSESVDLSKYRDDAVYLDVRNPFDVTEPGDLDVRRLLAQTYRDSTVPGIQSGDVASARQIEDDMFGDYDPLNPRWARDADAMEFDRTGQFPFREGMTEEMIGNPFSPNLQPYIDRWHASPDSSPSNDNLLAALGRYIRDSEIMPGVESVGNPFYMDQEEISKSISDLVLARMASTLRDAGYDSVRAGRMGAIKPLSAGQIYPGISWMEENPVKQYAQYMPALLGLLDLARGTSIPGRSY